MKENVGYIQIGTSHEPSEFACDSIHYWWTTYGKQRYPLADSMLLLCDGVKLGKVSKRQGSP
jgi:hypothetical protein